MSTPFSDITLYTPTRYNPGTPEFIEEEAIKNFVSDLYVQKMKGYKPPGATRITIQPAYHHIWNRTWKTGSIVATAPYFNYDEYVSLDKYGKYKRILDLIQSATIALSDEYGWDKSVFENAYEEVIKSNFSFRIYCTPKRSRDRKKTATLFIGKSETATAVSVNMETNGQTITRKLFAKRNRWWYDSAYILVKHSKWFDGDKFGIGYGKKLEVWYSLEQDEVMLFEDGRRVSEIDFEKYFPIG